MLDELQNFINDFKESLEGHTFVKMILSKPYEKSYDIKKITVNMVEIRSSRMLSFLFTYKTKDVTKNYTFDDGLVEVEKLLNESMKNCALFTTESTIDLNISKKKKVLISRSKPIYKSLIEPEINRMKKRNITIENNVYLHKLGVATSKNILIKNMQGKFKQINRFVETIDGLIKSSVLKDTRNITVADMGSGKGYLTFAVYDHLVNNLKITAEVTGVELRQGLIDTCNVIANECGFAGLKFVQGTINDYTGQASQMLIALHACDTATDDAIFKGITTGSEIIVVSPCCHKQVRKELNITNELKEITQHGILEERMAEMVTDTMRGLMLEAYGYKTKIFEYISDEHTHKNLMISAVKTSNKIDKDGILNRLIALKKTFGIEKFYLEELMKN
ncbi:MAG: SAM-dependent methyltransferase [Candidatus Delongbacteria bacterium]|nr:SAM-dependent methyltransferase [Candidatus Delongbacteria bacterium]